MRSRLLKPASLASHQEAQGRMMRTRGKQVTISSLLILVAIAFSTTELAQGAPPKAGNKPVARVKPKEPTACKLVGTVRGTKHGPVTAWE